VVRAILLIMWVELVGREQPLALRVAAAYFFCGGVPVIIEASLLA
ncbi:MAG: hypothetical protein ACI8W8_000960, partial [Rhodothermales bacterium]